MARIAGVDIPREKRLEISLTYIFGIGPHHARSRSATRTGIDPDTRVRDLTDEEVSRIRDYIDAEPQGRGRPAPRRPAGHQAQDGDRLLPGHPPPPRPAVRGQRTHTNARTRKGPKKTVAGKKKVEQVMAKPEAGGRRPRKRERKNVTYGVAHIKSSFNNTIVTHHRPGGQRARRGPRPATSASRAPASPRRSPPRWRPSGAPGGPWSTACARSTCVVKGPGSGRETAIRSHPERRHRGHRHQGRHPGAPQRLPPAQAAEGLNVSLHRSRARVSRRLGDQHLGHQGRDHRPRAPALPAGRARPRPPPRQPVRVPAPAPREAEGPLHLRPDREAVPPHLRRGQPPQGVTGENMLRYPRAAPRQRRLPRRLGRHPPPGPPARQPRPRRRQRQAGRHPELPGPQGRRRRPVDQGPGHDRRHLEPRRPRPASRRLARDRRRGLPRSPSATCRCASTSTCPCASSSSSSSTPSKPPAPGRPFNKVREETPCWSFSDPPSSPSARPRATDRSSPSARSSPASATPWATPCAAPCCRRSPARPSPRSASTTPCTSSTPSPGITEDVTDILLNLKDLVVVSHSDEPVDLRLDVRGAGRRHRRRHRDQPRRRDPQHGPPHRHPQRARPAWRSTSPSRRAGATARATGTPRRPPSASSPSTPSSRPCAGSPSRSSPPGSSRRPTTTASSSTSRPTAPSPPARPWPPPAARCGPSWPWSKRSATSPRASS